MIMAGMRGTEIEGQSGSNGFVFHLGVDFGQMLFLEQRVEEEQTAGDAGAFRDEMVGAFRGFETFEIEGGFLGGERPFPVDAFHVALLAVRSAKVQRTFGAT